MRPSRKQLWDRTMAGMSVGVLAATGLFWASDARADTVITGEGVFMPRGSTAKQFGGAFCRPTCVTVSSMPTSVRSQAAKLDAAVMASTGPTVVVLFSLSAVAGDDMVADWVADPATAPDPGRVWLVTTGNPLNRYGGTQRDRATAIPAKQPYRHLDVVNQYDSVADRPARWGWYSQRELSLSRHLGYPDIDINDPANLVYRDGNTTYMLVPAKDLRQLRGLRFLRDIGLVSEERYAEIDADRRAKIEADYDRPAYVEQGPGADWGNGFEPEALREETDVDQRNRLGADDANNADPALPENPENGGDVDVDLVADERQTSPGVHQRETSLDESLTWTTESGSSEATQGNTAGGSTRQSGRQETTSPTSDSTTEDEQSGSSPTASVSGSSPDRSEPKSSTGDEPGDAPSGDSDDNEGGDDE